MGLDINFYSMPKSYDLGNLSFVGYLDEFAENYNYKENKWRSDKNIVNVAYFRKNHDLHEWMKKFFFRKGGEKDKYGHLLNNKVVKISLEDLYQIKDDFRHEEDVMPIYEFEILKLEFEKGRVVYYYASY